MNLIYDQAKKYNKIIIHDDGKETVHIVVDGKIKQMNEITY